MEIKSDTKLTVYVGKITIPFSAKNKINLRVNAYEIKMKGNKEFLNSSVFNLFIQLTNANSKDLIEYENYETTIDEND